MVAVLDEYKKKLPGESFTHMMFILHTVPVSNYYYGDEPAWAKLQPCDQGGRPLRGQRPFSVALSWLDAGLRVQEDEEHEYRQAALVTFLLHKAQHIPNCDNRLKVSPCFQRGYQEALRPCPVLCGAGLSQ